MTNEEREKHLDWLYRLKSEIFVFMRKDWLIPFADALDVAIKALEQEPTTKNDKVDCEHADCNNCVNHKYCDYESTTKNDLPHCQHTDEEIAKSFIEDVEAVKDQLPTTKNDLGVDAVNREAVLDLIADYDLSMGQVVKGIHALPSVTPQEPRCKDCKWWKDSDGKYRRGSMAESMCPINTKTVFLGEGYCYRFEPKMESEDNNE